MGKTCKTCVFLSNIRIGAAVRCLVTNKLTIEDAPACEHHEKPGQARKSFRKIGRLLREVEDNQVEVL